MKLKKKIDEILNNKKALSHDKAFL
jgi:hypothetical protein